jgi:hypothetical protein
MNKSVLIRRLWAEHMAAAFPQAAYGIEIDGVNLVGLDADAAGIVQSVAEGSSLLPHQLTALGPTLQEMNKVVPILTGDVRSYFERLQTALRAIERNV